MDVRRLEVRIDRRDARLTVADAGGVREHVLDGEAFVRVLAAAKPLFDELARRVGPVVGITIDGVKRRLWAAGGEGGLKLEGDEYEGRAQQIGAIARVAVTEVRGSVDPPAGGPSSPEFWDALFQRGRDGWELGRPAPPLERWFVQHPPQGRRVLVVGAGRGNEARLLAKLGAQVTAVDFSDEAVTALRALAAAEGLTLEVRKQDLFTLDKGDWELWVEHACFCAIDPARRDEYVAAAAAALAPGGELVGLFWDHGRPGGPPFTTTREELERRFSPRFEWISDEVTTNSVVTRQGQERLVRMRMR
jgi:hypothetical protein